MQLDTDIVERIVLDVMEKLLTPAASPRADATAPPAASKPASAPNQAPTPAPQPAAGRGTVAFLEKVVTGELLQERVGTAKQIAVSPKTVLTPSAHDFLRSRGITVSREASSNGSQPAGASSRWKLLVSTTGGSVPAVIDDLLAKGVLVDRELVGTAAEAVRQATSHLCRADATGVVVLSAEALVVACLANRNRQVRGAEVGDQRSLATARQQLGANLLCINPTARSYFELRQLLQACLASGAPVRPEAWMEGQVTS